MNTGPVRRYAGLGPLGQMAESLYGPKLGPSVHARIDALLEQWKQRFLSARPGRNSGTADFAALLITYPDQIREPNAAPLRTLADFATQYLEGIVSGIHVLPFFPSSSDDGFAVKDFFAVDRAYGDWNDVALLGQKFELMFDAVFNHMSAQGEWFQRFLADEPQFREFFVSVSGSPSLREVVRPRALPLLTEFCSATGARKIWTTFSADQVDLNVKNPEVLLALLDALLFYVSKGARYIRLDAIAFLWKELGTSCLHLPQTHTVVRLFRAVLDRVAPQVQLVTETNVPHADNVSYFGDGTNEAQMVYNFALPPLVLHSFQTGSAAKLSEWAESLKPPSAATTFFNFLASHDGVGLNPARGILADSEIEALAQRTQARGGYISYKSGLDGAEIPYEMNINYLDALCPTREEPDEIVARRFLTAQAIMLSLQGVPGIYFHSLFGSRGDRAGAETSGIKRRINRQKLERKTLESDLTNPASLRARVFNGYRELLLERQRHAALAPSAPQRVVACDPRVFAILRGHAEGPERVICLHNVSGQTVVATPVTPVRVCVRLEPYAYRWIRS